MSAGLLVPCLLLDRFARTVTPALLSEAWPIIPVGLLYVALGCGLGALVAIPSWTPCELRAPTIAATAFANSQAMPIILIEVIGPELFGADGAELGVTFVGLYLMLYLVLQWTIGASLLDVPLITVGGGERQVTRSEASRGGDNSGSRASNGSSSIRANSNSNGQSASNSLCTMDVHQGESARNRMLILGQPTSDALDDGNSKHRSDALQPALDANGRCVASMDVEEGAQSNTTAHPRAGVTGSCRQAMLATAMRVASPPIYGIFAGLAVALIPPLRAALVGDSNNGSGCVLGFVLQAARLMGNAAIPINTMLLGASLSNGPKWSALPRETAAGIVLSKLLLMPLAALVLGFWLREVVQLPPMLLLVMLIESAMPTANNLMMMCELAGGKASAMMSTVIFLQYVISPVLLTLSLTAFMALVQFR